MQGLTTLSCGYRCVASAGLHPEINDQKSNGYRPFATASPLFSPVGPKQKFFRYACLFHDSAAILVRSDDAGSSAIEAIREFGPVDAAAFAGIVASGEPAVLRGQVAAWPAVAEGLGGGRMGRE